MKYNRRLFKFNSKKARQRLISENLMELHGLDVVLDHYNGRILNLSIDKWDAEHLLPLKSAWDMGFSKQYAKDKDLALSSMRSLSNNPDNLIIVGASSNRSRGHKTIWNWSPLNLAFVPLRNDAIRRLVKE